MLVLKGGGKEIKKERERERESNGVGKEIEIVVREGEECTHTVRLTLITSIIFISDKQTFLVST